MLSSRVLLPALAVGVLALAATAAPASVDAAPYYEGKTVTIIVGFRPGSGIDINARELARLMPPHIPGTPKMIVKNRAGGGTAAQNYMYEKARANGLMTVYGPWNPVGQITRHRALRVRYDKVAFIGGGGSTRITWGNTDAIPAPQKIVEASTKRVLNYGGNRVTGSIDLVSRLGLDVLGVNYKTTFGYDQRASMTAIPQNETQIATASLNNWIAYIVPAIQRHKKAAALYYYPRIASDGSFVRNRNTGDIPMFLDIYKAIHGRDVPPPSPEWNAMKWLLRMGTLSQTLWAPPGTPKEAVEALRTGFWKTVQSKEFIDHYMKNYGAPLDYASPEETYEVVASIEDFDPKIATFFKDYVAQGRKFKNIKKRRRQKRN